MINNNPLINEPEIIQQKIGYKFQDEKLLWQCIYHRSYYGKMTTDPNNQQERFELLGEAVINAIADDPRYTFPDWPQISFKTANGQGILANHLKIAEHIRAGKHEIEIGMQRNQQVMSSTLKALIGAMYQEANSDIYRVRDWFVESFGGKKSAIIAVEDAKMTKKQKKQIELLGNSVIHLIAVDYVYGKFDSREGKMITLAELYKKRMIEISEQHGYDYKYWAETYLIDLFSEFRDWLIEEIT